MAGIGAIGSYGSMSGYYSVYQNRNLWQNRSANPTSTGPVSPVSRAQTTPVPPVDRVPTVQRGAAQMVPEKEQAFPFPTMREGADPAEMAVRSRIRYLTGEEENELFGGNQSSALEKLLGGNQPDALGKLLGGDQSNAPEKLPGGNRPDALEKLLGSEEDSDKVKFPWEKDEEDDLTLGEEEDDDKSPQETMEEAECQTCKKRKYQDESDDPGVSFQTPTNVAPEQAASAVRGHEMEHVVREQAKARQEGRRVVSQSVTIHTGICPECGDVYVTGGTTRTVTKANPVKESQQEEDSKKSASEAMAK